MYFSLCTTSELSDHSKSKCSDVHKLKYTYSTAIKLERRDFSDWSFRDKNIGDSTKMAKIISEFFLF